jgi:hypothetical protein
VTLPPPATRIRLLAERLPFDLAWDVGLSPALSAIAFATNVEELEAAAVALNAEYAAAPRRKQKRLRATAMLLVEELTRPPA